MIAAFYYLIVFAVFVGIGWGIAALTERARYGWRAR